jgi:hypothetical protein
MPPEFMAAVDAVSYRLVCEAAGGRFLWTSRERGTLCTAGEPWVTIP